MTKYEALRDMVIELVEHRDNICLDDDITESTRMNLADGVDKNIETILLTFFNEKEVEESNKEVL